MPNGIAYGGAESYAHLCTPLVSEAGSFLKAHRLLYHSIQGSRPESRAFLGPVSRVHVIKKKIEDTSCGPSKHHGSSEDLGNIFSTQVGYASNPHPRDNELCIEDGEKLEN